MTTSGVRARPDDARPGVLSRHPLVFFFLIAYAGGPGDSGREVRTSR